MSKILPHIASDHDAMLAEHRKHCVLRWNVKFDGDGTVLICTHDDLDKSQACRYVPATNEQVKQLREYRPLLFKDNDVHRIATLTAELAAARAELAALTNPGQSCYCANCERLTKERDELRAVVEAAQEFAESREAYLLATEHDENDAGRLVDDKQRAFMQLLHPQKGTEK